MSKFYKYKLSENSKLIDVGHNNECSQYRVSPPIWMAVFFILIGAVFMGYSIYQDMQTSSQNLCVLNVVGVPMLLYVYLLVISCAMVLLVNNGLKWVFVRITKKIFANITMVFFAIIGFMSVYLVLIIMEPGVCKYVGEQSRFIQLVFGSVSLYLFALLGSWFVNLLKSRK